MLYKRLKGVKFNFHIIVNRAYTCHLLDFLYKIRITMKEAGDSIQTLNHEFSLLTEENRQSVIEMIKFLIITQNNIVPALFNFAKEKFTGEETLNTTGVKKEF